MATKAAASEQSDMPADQRAALDAAKAGFNSLRKVTEDKLAAQPKVGVMISSGGEVGRRSQAAKQATLRINGVPINIPLNTRVDIPESYAKLLDQYSPDIAQWVTEEDGSKHQETHEEFLIRQGVTIFGKVGESGE
jgi:hypothetical protein